MLQLASSQLPTLNWDESLLRLALAALLGGLIGFERELREREAGLRTHLLVSLGSALFTIVGAYGSAFLDSERASAYGPDEDRCPDRHRHRLSRRRRDRPAGTRCEGHDSRDAVGRRGGQSRSGPPSAPR